MEKSGRAGVDFAETCQKLKNDLQAVFSVLPEDMQQLLLMNPERATLLQVGSQQNLMATHPYKLGHQDKCKPWNGNWWLLLYGIFSHSRRLASHVTML